MRTRLPKTLAALALLAAIAALAGCQPSCERGDCAAPAGDGKNDTLGRIRERGAIVLGYRESSVPFSYYDNDRNVIGYSHDLARQIVDEVKSELGLPDLRVELVPVSPENRWAMVAGGRVDLECGTSGHTAERAQTVAFSNSIFIVRMRILTRKDYGIVDFPDLAGKTVVTTAGTTNVDKVRRMNEELNLGVNTIVAKDHGEAFHILESGRAAAFLMDDVLLYGERARAIRWGDWVVTGTPQSREAYACIMRRNDPAFKQLVDRALGRAMAPEAFAALYEKWFLRPVPPKGIKLDFPLSDDMRELIAAPNDRVLQ